MSSNVGLARPFSILDKCAAAMPVISQRDLCEIFNSFLRFRQFSPKIIASSEVRFSRLKPCTIFDSFPDDPMLYFLGRSILPTNHTASKIFLPLIVGSLVVLGLDPRRWQWATSREFRHALRRFFGIDDFRAVSPEAMASGSSVCCSSLVSRLARGVSSP
jgi:hypothetical protein